MLKDKLWKGKGVNFVYDTFCKSLYSYDLKKK